MVAASGAVLCAAAACGGPSQPSARVAGSTARGGAPAASPTTLTSAQRSHVWLAYAACLRAHGASEPDPTFDQDGNPQWAVNLTTLPDAAVKACQSGLQAVSTGKPQSAAQIAQTTRYSQCMRQHGIPDFPDPDPQTGRINLPGTAAANRKGDPGFQAAQQACQQLVPGKNG
jgi:hypothetical protein